MSVKNAGVFEDTLEIRPGLSLSAHLPGSGEVTGIYMLHFANGEKYIGQAVDVVRRCADHCRHHPDVIAISLRRVLRDDLDEAERASIAAFERTYQLRNKLLTGRPGGPAALDLIVPPARRQAWMSGVRDEGPSTPRHVDLGSEPSPRYLKLAARRDYPAFLAAVAAFIDTAVCCPRTTEQDFWTIAALPSTCRGNGWHRLVTVNANNLEILVLREHRGGQFHGFINMGPLEPADRAAERRLDRLAPERDVWRSRVGGALTTLHVNSYEDLHFLLYEPTVALAAQTLATNLMIKGPSMNARSHSVHLAGDVLDLLPARSTNSPSALPAPYIPSPRDLHAARRPIGRLLRHASSRRSPS